jgi:hypothetical protein
VDRRGALPGGLPIGRHAIRFPLFPPIPWGNDSGFRQFCAQSRASIPDPRRQKHECCTGLVTNAISDIWLDESKTVTGEYDPRLPERMNISYGKNSEFHPLFVASLEGVQAMWPIVETVLHRLEKTLHGHNIEWALALHRRGEVRSDGLEATRISNHLEIEWTARKIHPWDRGQGGDSGFAFLDQTLADTDAALARLFEALPLIDAITLRIFDPASGAAIIAGTVYRSAISEVNENVSVRMRLNRWGLKFRSTGFCLEPLEPEGIPSPPDRHAASPELPAYFS